MGTCYYVKLKVKLPDEEKAIKTLRDKISGGEKEYTNYVFNSCLKNKNDDLNIFDNLIRMFLVEHQNDFMIAKTKKGFTKISGFGASYGWETVILEMFEEISPYLEDKSKLFICCDDEIDLLIIKNGKCIQKKETR